MIHVRPHQAIAWDPFMGLKEGGACTKSNSVDGSVF